MLTITRNKKPVKLFGSLEIPITSKGWKIENACFLVSENCTRNLLGLNLHEKLGIETVQRGPAEVSLAEEEQQELDPTSQFWRDYFVKRSLMCSAGWGGRKIIKFSRILKTLWCLDKLKAEKSLYICKIESRLNRRSHD